MPDNSPNYNLEQSLIHTKKYIVHLQLCKWNIKNSRLKGKNMQINLSLKNLYIYLNISFCGPDNIKILESNYIQILNTPSKQLEN